MGTHVSLEQLSELIHALNTAERDFYKKMYCASDAPALPARLFLILLEQETISPPDAAALLEIQSQSQFSNLKKHLLQTLLDTMVFKSRMTDTAAGMQLHYLYIEKLLQKRQLSLAMRQSKLAIQQTMSSHQYALSVQLMEQYQRLLQEHGRAPYLKEFSELETLWQEALAHLQVLGKIKNHFSRLLMLSRQTPIRYSQEEMQTVSDIAKGLEELKQNGLFDDFLRLLWLGASVKASYMQRQYERSAAFGTAFLEILAAAGFLAASAPFVFLETANTLFYNHFALGGPQQVAELLTSFHAIAQENLKNEWLEKWEIIALHTELKLAHKAANYGRVAELLQPYAQRTAQCQQLFCESEQLNFLCSLAISHFVLANYEAANELMYGIKTQNLSAQREDILYFSSLFHLLILYEKKDWYQLDIQAQATYHALYAKKKLRPFEKEIVLFIKKLSGFRNPKELAAACSDLLKRLEIFSSPAHRQLFFPYFNYPGWLQSKAAGLSYRQYCEQELPDARKEKPAA